MPSGDHQLKRIVLPSGKTIEVVFFDHAAAAPPAVPAPAGFDAEADPGLAEADPKLPVHVERIDTERDLHLCVNCKSHLVYPVHWEEADERSWNVTLRCPNCEWTEGGVFPQSQCDRFDDELEAGTEALTRDYRQMVTANMVEEVERFAAALQADAILPIDF